MEAIKFVKTYDGSMVTLTNGKQMTLANFLKAVCIKYGVDKKEVKKELQKLLPKTPAEEIIQLYAENEISSQVLLNRLSWNEYQENYSLIQKAEQYRNSKPQLSRDMQAIWITGKSGSGKTTLAKYIAETKGMEVFITNNSDNMFDGYDLQPCIIVDEFRPTMMKFSSWLQLTDNHTGKKQQARYHDVDLSYCKLMIFTSINDPLSSYSMFRSDDGSSNTEPIEQFTRRLRHRYYQIFEGYICLVDTQTGDKTHVMNMEKVNTYFGIEPNKVDDKDILSDMYDFNFKIDSGKKVVEEIEKNITENITDEELPF